MQIDFNNIDIVLQIEYLKIHIEHINYGVFTSSLPKHHHNKHYYEVHLICGGMGTLLIHDSSYVLSDKVLFMTGPGIDHEQITCLDNPMVEYCIGFEIYNTSKKPISLSPFCKGLLETHFWIGKDTSGECQRLFELLETESMNRNIGYLYKVKSILSSILVELVRNYTQYATSTDYHFFSPDNRRAYIIDNYFLSQYATCSENELSCILHLSRRQLQRYLKENYSKTFSDMKRIARLNKAHELIGNGISIEKAATLVGYENFSYFNKIYFGK